MVEHLKQEKSSLGERYWYGKLPGVECVAFGEGEVVPLP